MFGRIQLVFFKKMPLADPTRSIKRILSQGDGFAMVWKFETRQQKRNGSKRTATRYVAQLEIWTMFHSWMLNKETKLKQSGIDFRPSPAKILIFWLLPQRSCNPPSHGHTMVCQYVVDLRREPGPSDLADVMAATIANNPCWMRNVGDLIATNGRRTVVRIRFRYPFYQFIIS